MSDDGGVPLHYDLVTKRWDISFPETTGYIIPTFLCYAQHGGGDEFVRIAQAMGDWEISIKAINGAAGEPIGWFHRPRVFNTGMVLLGWLALFCTTGETRYLEACHDAAQFLLRYLEPDGSWREYTYMNAPRAYKVRVAWALSELFRMTGYRPYRAAAQKAVGWVLLQARGNGWFENNGMTADRSLAWTHPIAYTLRGLLAIYESPHIACDRSRIRRILTTAADHLVRWYLRRHELRRELPYTGFPGWFDRRWRSSAAWSCVTGNIQLEFYLRRLACLVDKPDYLTVANALLDETKLLHLVEGIDDPDLHGGLPGSDPIGGAYHRYSIPNWGVKFFADALLQRLSPPEEHLLLG